MISIEGLTKIYRSETGDVVALKNVNLKVSAGEVFGIIAPVVRKKHFNPLY